VPTPAEEIAMTAQFTGLERRDMSAELISVDYALPCESAKME
jgi:hypothetical protein